MTARTSGDPVEDAFRHLTKLGRSRNSFVMAALGLDADDTPQLLIAGHGSLQLADLDGTVRLEVGFHEVRGMRSVSSVGLEIWITPRGPEGLRERLWIHRIDDASAERVELWWLQHTPMLHFGIQPSIQDWREEAYALYVGRVITTAARADVSLLSLIRVAESALDVTKPTSLTASGNQLGKALARIGVASAAFRDLAERYRAWYDYRNFIAHGLRSWDGERAFVTKFKTSEGVDLAQSTLDLDLADLARVQHAFEFLGHDANSLHSELLRATITHTQLADLVPQVSVSPDDRLPSPLTFRR